MNRMSDNLKSLPEENIEKIKVSNAEIVVRGTKEKPYFEIKYFDLSDNETHIGYSSYNLDIVFGYLDKYFDIVEKDERGDDYPYNDLISRKAVIEAVDRHTREDGTLDDDISIILEEVKTTFDKEKVLEELNDAKDDPHDDSVAEITATRIWNKAIARSIKIVEKGGIE